MVTRHGWMRQDSNAVHPIEDGYGVALDDVTLQAAITAIGVADKKLMLTPGVWVIANNLTIPANITLYRCQGAGLSINAGKVLTIQGHIIDDSTIMLSGVGNLTAGPGQVIGPPGLSTAVVVNKSPTPANQLVRVSDGFGGIAFSDGFQWAGINAPTYRPDQQIGSGFAARVNAAIAKMPATGGTVDCRSFQGSTVWDSTVTVDRPVMFLMGHSTFVVTATPAILTTGNGRLCVHGPSLWGTSFVSALAAVEVIKHTANAQLVCENLLFQTQLTQTGGAAITINPATFANHHLVRQCGFDGYYRSIFIGNANSILIDHCGFANCRFAGIQTQFIPGAPDASQTKITNCDFDSGDFAGSIAACVLIADSGGIYMENNTILNHGYGVIVQCTEAPAFNEFVLFNNRISHQRFYGVLFQRLAGTGSMNGIQIMGNQFGASAPTFAASIGFPTFDNAYVDRVRISDNDFTLNSAGDMGVEASGGKNIVIEDNNFFAGNPLARAIEIGALSTPYIRPNVYIGFAPNQSVTPNMANAFYTPIPSAGSIVVNPGSIGANSIGFVDVAVPGLRADQPDVVLLQSPALETGLIYQSCLVVANDVLRIFLENRTASPIDGASRAWVGVNFNHVI